MTVKELALFTGKTVRAVQKWIKKAGEKSSSISEKSSSSTSSHPADYSIDEVEVILISGSMSKDAVGILMDNARRESPKADGVDYALIGNMIGMAVKAALEPVLLRLDGIPQTPRVGMIEAPKVRYMSLAGYCSLNKIDTSLSELKKMGMTIRKLSIAAGKPPKPIPDPRWGKVNSYHIDILDEYFEV